MWLCIIWYHDIMYCSKVSSSWISNGTCISYDVMYCSVKWTSATCGQVRYPHHRRWTVAGGQGVGCFQIQHRHLIHWKKTPRHFCYKISSTGNKNCCTCTSISLNLLPLPLTFPLGINDSIWRACTECIDSEIRKHQSGHCTICFIFLIILAWQILFTNQTYYII